MKKVLINILLFFGISLSGQQGALSVDITGVVAEWAGEIKFGLFDKKGFPKEGQINIIRTWLLRRNTAYLLLLAAEVLALSGVGCEKVCAD